jgi:hypothetical protein
MRINQWEGSLSSNPKSEIRNPKCRGGSTLTEVLIAMFVLAIGLMGILALFPMGALQMAQAVKDERTTQTSKIMEGRAKFLWLEAWVNAQGLKDEPTVLNATPEFAALDNPIVLPNQVAAYVNGVMPGTNYQADRLRSSPSSPVFIDPIGQATQPAGNSRNWVGGVNGVLARRTVTFSGVPVGTALPTTVRIALCSLMDDLTFDTNGLPANFGVAANPSVRRAGDYNAAWLIQRPKNNLRTEINVQVVVYRKRPPADTFAPETRIDLNLPTTLIYPGSRQLSVTLNNGIPVPKAGTWLLLAGTANPAGTTEPFADFYRVVSVAGTLPNVTIEFNRDIRAHDAQGMTFPYAGILIQMENVVEVFDKGTLSINERPTQ